MDVRARLAARGALGFGLAVRRRCAVGQFPRRLGQDRLGRRGLGGFKWRFGRGGMIGQGWLGADGAAVGGAVPVRIAQHDGGVLPLMERVIHGAQVALEAADGVVETGRQSGRQVGGERPAGRIADQGPEVDDLFRQIGLDFLPRGVGGEGLAGGFGIGEGEGLGDGFEAVDGGGDGVVGGMGGRGSGW
jgi:hypothetical protein